MTNPLRRVPWFITAAGVVALAAALAIGTNVLVGPYFERSFLDEADPLAAASDATPAPRATAPGTVPTQSVAEPTPSPPADGPGVLLQGEWQDGEPGHNGEGIAKVIRTAEGKLVLRLEEFSVTNGPDLFVVLSPDDNGYADGSLTLDALRATDGNINYDIPDGTDLAQYKSAVIWCRGARVTFAYATLEPVT